MAFSEIEKRQRRLGALKKERESFVSHYQELSDFIQPRRGRFFPQDRNRGTKRFGNIVNSRATMALRIATAGMLNGLMSPTRPWVVTETDDPHLLEFGPVKEWFFFVQQEMLRIFNRSNLYNAAPIMFMEELLFGTGCLSHEDHPLQLCKFYPHTAGTYFIAQNQDMVVNTVVREFDMTVEQIIAKFSTSRREINKDISPAVRTQYDQGNYDLWFPVVQFVDENPDFVSGSRRSRDRKFRSVYYEPSDGINGKFLSERGFDEFPFYCPRWEVTGEDVYGTNCPGMTALGDVKQLQLEEREKAKGIQMMVRPPLHGPPTLANVPIQNVPGGSTLYDSQGDQKGLRAIHEVRLPIQELTLDIKEVERRINEAFYVPLFLAITDMEGVQPRNQLELMQRNQERLLQLGPVLERQFYDFLDPLISRTFNQMVEADMLPPPPRALQGRPLKPRYVSSLAMAQQAVSTGNIDRLAAFVAGLVGQGFPRAAYKFDELQAVDEYAHLIGAPPRLVVSDEMVQKRLEAEQQQTQYQQQLEGGQAAANIGKMMSDTKLDDDSVASRVVKQAAGER